MSSGEYGQQLKERTESQLILENLPGMEPIKTPLLLMGQAFIHPVWSVCFISHTLVSLPVRSDSYRIGGVLWIKEVHEKIREQHAMVHVCMCFTGDIDNATVEGLLKVPGFVYMNGTNWLGTYIVSISIYFSFIFKSLTN